MDFRVVAAGFEVDGVRADHRPAFDHVHGIGETIPDVVELAVHRVHNQTFPTWVAESWGVFLDIVGAEYAGSTPVSLEVRFAVGRARRVEFLCFRPRAFVKSQRLVRAASSPYFWAATGSQGTPNSVTPTAISMVQQTHRLLSLAAFMCCLLRTDLSVVRMIRTRYICHVWAGEASPL